jgi:hypothetical protein
MNDPKLFVQFELNEEKENHVQPAARMKLDGRGGLILYDDAHQIVDMIRIRNLRALAIHSITRRPVAVTA